ncbi:receptor kinase-like protein Xa21 [Medicago truncatula]|uniref:receptor kinase-like protein Xa21 n=1 Tax=Medicago truncatula TaxID=3880 RepID=UPI001967679A|nr:receptor kinase-like protein Xa21 [Medicago truncatula]
MPSATVTLALSSAIDEHALLALKEKLTNGVQDSLPSWNESLHFCEWQGVECGRRHMRVSVLHLENQNLGGTLGPSLGNLTFLRMLNLSNVNLHGEIPKQVGRLKRLQVLDLRFNHLLGEIPIELANCTNIKILSFSSNKLSGDIPNQTFGYLDGLIYIDLANNSLTGPIPSEFGNLKHLSALYLNLNKLSGEIPKYLASCLDLTELWLGINFFYGAIPLFLGSSLRSLEVLDLSVNNFSSIIPIELENLTFLNNLNLSFNNLYGEVPTRGVFGNVSAISLTGNKNLCGGIPRLELPPFLKKSKKVTSSSPFLINGSLRVTYGFSSSNLVGRGGFGSVYKGSLLYFERPIVVKVLNLETPGAVKSFVVECKALGNMKHRNLVKILTCCSSVDYKGEDFKAIVFEFMPNGSLENLLHGNKEHESRNLNLNFTQRLDIVLNVAHALDYLHIDAEQVVVHSGVKPSNVLLDDDNVAHLGDFGLARLIRGATEHSSKDQVISSTIKGTIGYVPPGKVLFITYLFLSFKMFYILMPYLYISY